jgi:adenylate cyclase
MKKIFTHWIFSVVILSVIMLWGYSDPFAKQTARLKSFDLIQRYDVPTLSQDVAIVEIDEKSIERYGQWPWKRDVMADIIYRLRDAGAGVIVLPILFSEPDRLGGDEALAQAMKDNGVIIAQVGTTQTNKNAVPRGVAKIGDPMPWLYEWPGMLGPIESLGTTAAGVGVINTAPEIDGVVRRIPLLMRVGTETYPAIAIETIRVAVGDPSYQVKTQQGGITAMRIPKYKTIQTDANARIWLRWNKEFLRVSATDDFKSLSGKTVIVGITAEGLGGVIATPNGEAYSHTAIATGLQTIINGDNIVRLDYATFLEYTSTAIIAFILILTAAYAPYWLVGTLLILIYSGAAYGSYFAFTRHLQLWDVSWLYVVITITSFHAVFNRFVKEFFEKQAIKKQFAGYASPHVVRLLQENPALVKEGIKKEVSICFSDLRGFTPLGESFGDDVKGLTRIMNGYMDAITQPVLNANGMIIKYIGDASMHIHNAPLDDADHPKTAVQTGLNMLKAVKEFNRKITAEGRPPVGMGAGINTGLGYIGEMGSTQRHSYDVLGDAVSTTARLESQCKNYGVLLIIGPETVRRTENDFLYLKLDDLAVKGKTVGLDIYTVLDLDRSKYQADTDSHNEMHKLYRQQEFQQAMDKCVDLQDAFEGEMQGYYKMWMERCEFMKTQVLPSDWNGVHIATTK